MDDGRIGHAELRVAGATLYLADEYPEMGLAGPERRRVSVSLHLTVPDVDAAVDRAVDGRRDLAAGLRRPVRPHRRARRPVRPPLDAADPGHGRAASAPRPGDTVYLTLQVPDGARARDFYEAVLGWSAVPGPGARRLAGPGRDADDGHRRRRDRARRRPDVRRRRHRGRRRGGPDGGRRGRRDRPAAVRAHRASAATTRDCPSTWVSSAERSRPVGRLVAAVPASRPRRRAARRPAAGRGARAGGGRPPG